MTNKHIKKCSILIVIQDMQIKTTMHYYYTRASQFQHLTFWTKYFFVVRAALYVLGCLAESLASTRYVSVATDLPTSCENQKCIQTLSNDSNGAKSPPVKNRCTTPIRLTEMKNIDYAKSW